jgi:hypothetical protein
MDPSTDRDSDQGLLRGHRSGTRFCLCRGAECWRYHEGADDLSGIGPKDCPAYRVRVGWDLDAYRTPVPGTHFDAGRVGTLFRSRGDVVSSAPELAQLTLIIAAATDHDERVDTAGRLAGTPSASPSVRAPSWAGPPADYTGPVSEGDSLTSELHVEGADDLGDGGVLHLRSLVFSHTATALHPVLDWRLSALIALGPKEQDPR